MMALELALKPLKRFKSAMGEALSRVGMGLGSAPRRLGARALPAWAFSPAGDGDRRSRRAGRPGAHDRPEYSSQDPEKAQFTPGPNDAARSNAGDGVRPDALEAALAGGTPLTVSRCGRREPPRPPSMPTLGIDARKTYRNVLISLNPRPELPWARTRDRRDRVQRLLRVNPSSGIRLAYRPRSAPSSDPSWSRRARRGRERDPRRPEPRSLSALRRWRCVIRDGGQS